MRRTIYSTIEMFDEVTLKPIGYYQSLRNRPGQLPEACPHKHLTEKEARKCRAFLEDA